MPEACCIVRVTPVDQGGSGCHAEGARLSMSEPRSPGGALPLDERRDDWLRHRPYEVQIGPDREARSLMLRWFRGQYTRFGEGVK